MSIIDAIARLFWSQTRVDQAITGVLNGGKRMSGAEIISEPDGVDTLSGAREFAKLALTPAPT